MGEGSVKERLDELVAQVSDSEISSIKNVTSGIIRIINNPASNARDLKGIIEYDPPLSAKVLRIANSAYYYSRRHISDIEEAVIWIGFENLKEIALNQKVCEIFCGNEGFKGFSRAKLWKHCIAVALLSKMIYRMEFGESGENVYAAGLLHDIGIITEDQFLHEEFYKILAKSSSSSSIVDAESLILNFNHADIGREICRSWQFPDELSQSIAGHHKPEETSPEYSKMAHTLYVANYKCHENGISYMDGRFKQDQTALMRSINFLGLKIYALDMIVKNMLTEVARMEGEGFF